MMEEPHNIVFLDVDGVLNTIDTKERSPMGYIGIQRSRVKILHEILKDNQAALVLSTTWKRTWSRNLPELTMDKDAAYMVTIFAEEGVFACDKTVDDGDDRGRGIAKWLNAHPHLGWVVIDDERFPDFNDYGICAHLIQTSFATGGGLKEKHIQKAKMLFDRQVSGRISTNPQIPDYKGSNYAGKRHKHFGKN